MTQRDEAERLKQALTASLCPNKLEAQIVTFMGQQAAEIERLRDDLSFVERWAVHHGQKPHHTAEQVLSMIQHYPPINAITKSYSNGKVPDTHDPYAEIERLNFTIAALEGTLTSLEDKDREIERLTTECKSFEANAYKTKVEAQTTFDHMKSEIERKDALLRDALAALTDSRNPELSKLIANIKTELGETK